MGRDGASAGRSPLNHFFSFYIYEIPRIAPHENWHVMCTETGSGSGLGSVLLIEVAIGIGLPKAPQDIEHSPQQTSAAAENPFILLHKEHTLLVIDIHQHIHPPLSHVRHHCIHSCFGNALRRDLERIPVQLELAQVQLELAQCLYIIAKEAKFVSKSRVGK